MHGREQRIQRGSTGFALLERAVDDRVVNVDDLPLHLHGVGQQHLVVEDAHEALGDRRLAVSGRAIQKDLRVRDDRRPDLIEGLLGQHEVVEDLLQTIAIDLVLGGLPAHGGVVGVQRHRGRTHILADRVAVLSNAAARPAQGQRVVVADHALDLDELLLAQVREDLAGDADVDLHALGDLAQRAFALEHDHLQHDVDQDVLPDAQVFDPLRNRRLKLALCGRAHRRCWRFRIRLPHSSLSPGYQRRMATGHRANR